MARSISECERALRDWQFKLEEATKQIKWWTDEMAAARREETEKSSQYNKH